MKKSLTIVFFLLVLLLCGVYTKISLIPYLEYQHKQKEKSALLLADSNKAQEIDLEYGKKVVAEANRINVMPLSEAEKRTLKRKAIAVAREENEKKQQERIASSRDDELNGRYPKTPPPPTKNTNLTRENGKVVQIDLEFSKRVFREHQRIDAMAISKEEKSRLKSEAYNAALAEKLEREKHRIPDQD